MDEGETANLAGENDMVYSENERVSVNEQTGSQSEAELAPADVQVVDLDWEDDGVVPIAPDKANDEFEDLTGSSDIYEVSGVTAVPGVLSDEELADVELPLDSAAEQEPATIEPANGGEKVRNKGSVIEDVLQKGYERVANAYSDRDHYEGRENNNGTSGDPERTAEAGTRALNVASLSPEDTNKSELATSSRSPKINSKEDDAEETGTKGQVDETAVLNQSASHFNYVDVDDLLKPGPNSKVDHGKLGELPANAAPFVTDSSAMTTKESIPGSTPQRSGYCADQVGSSVTVHSVDVKDGGMKETMVLDQGSDAEGLENTNYKSRKRAERAFNPSASPIDIGSDSEVDVTRGTQAATLLGDLPVVLHYDETSYDLVSPKGGVLDRIPEHMLSMDELFTAVRRAVPGIPENRELVFTLPQLELVLCEDNIYSKETTIEDMLELLAVCPGADMLTIDLSHQSRFISRLNHLFEKLAETPPRKKLRTDQG